MNEGDTEKLVSEDADILALVTPALNEINNDVPIEPGTGEYIGKKIPVAPSPVVGENKQLTKVWTYPSDGYRFHRQMLSRGVPVENLKHKKLVIGCQCAACKTRRNEFVLSDLSESAVEGASNGVNGDDEKNNEVDIIKTLMSESLIADIIDIPNRCVALGFEMAGAPSELLADLDTPPNDMAKYGEVGKLLFDKYFNLPDFKYKDVVIFSSWYASGMLFRVGAASAKLKKWKKENGKNQ